MGAGMIKALDRSSWDKGELERGLQRAEYIIASAYPYLFESHKERPWNATLERIVGDADWFLHLRGGDE